MLWYSSAGTLYFFILVAILTNFESECLASWDQKWLFTNYCICLLIAMPPGIFWGHLVQPNSDQFHMLITPTLFEPLDKTSIDELLDLLPEQPLDSQKAQECSVCLRDMKPFSTVSSLPCSHTFHPRCIKQWLSIKPECPLCRDTITKRKLKTHCSL